MRVLLIFAAAALVLLALPLPPQSRLGLAITDFAHVPTFALLSLALALATERQRLSRPRRGLLVFLLPLLFGLTIEGIQSQVGRTASLTDFGLNLIGIIAGLLINAALSPATPQRLLAGFTALLLLVLPLQPSLHWAWTYWQRQQALPDLLAIESGALRPLIASNGRAPLVFTHKRLPIQGQEVDQALIVVPLHSGRWPGLRLSEAAPDWQGYQSLVLELYSPLAQPVRMSLRIQDRYHNQRYHDRFNHHFPLQPGYNRLEVALDDIRKAPEKRELDLSAVTSVYLFGQPQAPTTSLYVLGLHLSESPVQALRVTAP